MSEFGSGVVVCLAKFSQHLDNIHRFKETYTSIGKDETSVLYDAITMAMNGASDHFYDLDRDKAPESLIKLADLTLEIGHGFRGGVVYTQDTVDEIFKLWEESCLAVDKMLGVDGDWGTW
jgi:hypothetical protein